MSSFEFSLSGSRKYLLNPKDLKAFKDHYPGLDVEAVLHDTVKKSRNLRLTDSKALFLLINNELSVARTKAADRVRELQAKKAKRELDARAAEDAKRVQEAAPVRPIDSHSETVSKPPKKANMTVELFKSTKAGALQVMVQTNASSMDIFTPALAKALSEAIHNDPTDVDEMIRAVLAAAFPLAIRISGYKVESVKEQRILVSGHVTPDEADMVGHADI